MDPRTGGKKRSIKLPIILNICLYNGKGPYKWKDSLLDLFEDSDLAKEYMFKGFQLVDLYSESEEQILKDKKASLVELLLKQGIYRDFSSWLKKYGNSLLLLLEHGDTIILKWIILYILVLDKDKDTLKELEMLHPGIKPIVNSAADRLIKKGRQEGEKFKALAIARNLLGLNIPLLDIQKATGLSQEELQKLS